MSSARTDIPFSGGRRQRTLAAVLRNTLRLLVKPLFHPAVPTRLLRQGLQATSAITLEAKGVERTTLDIDGLKLEKHSPKQASASQHIILYLHGGAYCVGSPATHRSLTSQLARQCHAEVFVPDYRLAPEHPFPAASDDALACYLWLLDNGYRAEQITLAGDSAGGGLALATAMRIRDEQLPPPAGMILISPWADLTHPRADSKNQPAEYMLSWPTLEHAAQSYAADDRENPYVSPLFGDLARLPEALIVVGSEEILLGDAERLTDALQQAGGRVSLQVYQGMWHVFPVHAGLLDMSDQAIRVMADFVSGAKISPAAS